MRAYYVTMRINSWFARCVYGRDALDCALVSLAARSDHYLIAIVVALVRLVVFIGRGVMWVLLQIAGMLTFALSRQMEYDADYVQTRFSGSECYAATSRAIHMLGAAQQQSSRRVREHLRAQQLPDDMSALVVEAVGELSADDRDQIERELKKGSTRLFDTHPATGVRMALAARRAEPGIFQSDEPAEAIFDNLDLASKRATENFWAVHLGDRRVAAASVATVGDAARRGTVNKARRDALASMMGIDPPLWRPLTLAMRNLRPSEDIRRDAQRLKAARQRLREVRERVTGADVEFAAADRALHEFLRARAALEHGVSVREMKDAWQFECGGRAHVADSIDKHQNRCAEAASRLDEALDLAGVRFSAALRLLAHPAIERYLPDAAAKRARAGSLLAAQAAMRDALPSARDMRPLLAEVEAITLAAMDKKRFDALKVMARRRTERLHGALCDIRSKCGEAPDPYPPPGDVRSLGGRVVSHMPPAGELVPVLDAAIDTNDVFPREIRRIVAELAEIALAVETALSAKSTADPAEKPQR